MKYLKDEARGGIRGGGIRGGGKRRSSEATHLLEFVRGAYLSPFGDGGFFKRKEGGGVGRVAGIQVGRRRARGGPTLKT